MLVYLMFIFIIIFLTVLFGFFYFFVFQFQKSHRVIGVSHGKKLNLNNLTVSVQREANDWLWES